MDLLNGNKSRVSQMTGTAGNMQMQIHWVFVHGAGSSGDFWEFVRADFPDAWMVDLPGHAAGRARRPGVPPPAPSGPPLRTIPAFADWLSAEITARGWPEVVLAGHSMGGAIVQEVGVRRPPWLRGLVLSGTGARLRVAPELLERIPRDFPGAVAWLIDHYFAGAPDPYRREGLRRSMLRIGPEVCLADFEACNAFDVIAPLRSGALAGPAVVICGDQDVMTPPKYSELLAAQITPSLREVIPNAGHMAPLEQPAAWSATVRRLWADLATASRPG